MSRAEENVEQMRVGSRMAASRREEGRMRWQRWVRRRCNRTPELIACPAKDPDAQAQKYSYQLIPVQMSLRLFCAALVGRQANSEERAELAVRGEPRSGEEREDQSSLGGVVLVKYIKWQ